MSDYLESKFQQAEIDYGVFALSVSELLTVYAEQAEETESEAAQNNWRRIITLTVLAGMKDEDIQEHIGTSPGTVYRWQHEDVRPKFKTRIIMAEAMAEFFRKKYLSKQSA